MGNDIFVVINVTKMKIKALHPYGIQGQSRKLSGLAEEDRSRTYLPDSSSEHTDLKSGSATGRHPPPLKVVDSS